MCAIIVQFQTLKCNQLGTYFCCNKYPPQPTYWHFIGAHSLPSLSQAQQAKLLRCQQSSQLSRRYAVSLG
jgi:hypothetical protein